MVAHGARRPDWVDRSLARASLLITIAPAALSCSPRSRRRRSSPLRCGRSMPPGDRSWSAGGRGGAGGRADPTQGCSCPAAGLGGAAHGGTVGRADVAPPLAASPPVAGPVSSGSRRCGRSLRGRAGDRVRSFLAATGPCRGDAARHRSDVWGGESFHWPWETVVAALQWIGDHHDCPRGLEPSCCCCSAAPVAGGSAGACWSPTAARRVAAGCGRSPPRYPADALPHVGHAPARVGLRPRSSARDAAPAGVSRVVVRDPSR